MSLNNFFPNGYFPFFYFLWLLISSFWKCLFQNNVPLEAKPSSLVQTVSHLLQRLPQSFLPRKDGMVFILLLNMTLIFHIHSNFTLNSNKTSHKLSGFIMWNEFLYKDINVEYYLQLSFWETEKWKLVR